MKSFDKTQILESDSRFRRNLINCLSGYKSLNLIGTQSRAGKTNLAPLSQVFHLGASPPLVGILFRPHTVKRDSLENILTTGFFTLNQVSSDFFLEAHWTAAQWEESEFKATGIKEEYLHEFFAPFVSQSKVQVGCKLVESQTLQVNQTVLVIGSIECVFIDEKGLRVDGSLDLEVLDTVTVTGLDEYYLGKKLGRLEYPKPDKKPEEI